MEEQVEMKRGFWLTAFLILMFAANPFSAYFYFSNAEIVTQAFPNASIAMVYFFGFLAVLNVIFAAGIWAWKKWGVFGFYAVVAISFLLNLYIEAGIGTSLLGLIGGVLIFVTTKKRWRHFA